LRQGDRPAVVNVASMCGRRGVPAWPEYSASKFALVGLSEALRAEMVRFGVDVLVINPGLTRSELRSHLLRNTGRMNIDFHGGMPPEKVADGIVRALVRNRAETVLGWEARWILRVNCWLPRLVDALMARKVRQLYPEGGSHSGIRGQAEGNGAGAGLQAKEGAARGEKMTTDR
jgi:short-subunit dehydrogenase